MLKKLGGQVAYYTSLGASDSTSCDRTAVRPPATQKLAKWLKQADLAGAPAAVIELAPSMLQNHSTSGVEFDLLCCDRHATFATSRLAELEELPAFA